nr:hypothetical protein [Arthrobacter sp. CAL618]
MPKTQRYRIADRFTSDELARLVARYQDGEMSTALAASVASPNQPFFGCLRSMASTLDPAA